jgi:DNA polymerase-3 subunit beta
MKFVMERDAALRALGFTNRVVARRNTVPILAHALVTAGKSKISFRGTDMDRLLDAEVVGGGSAKTGSTTVNAANLLSFVRATADGSQIEAELNGDKLTLRSGRARVLLPTLPVADFPTLKADDSYVEIAVAGETLTKAIDRVAHAMSNETTRYYLNGIYLYRHGARLRLVATDGHRLAWTEFAASSILPEELPSIIIPRQSIGEIKALATEAKGDDLSLEISTTGLRCTGRDVEFHTKLVDGTFPDYQRVIPDQHDCQFTTTSAALSAAVTRCASLGDNTHGVKLEISKGTAQLSRNHPDAGSISDEIDVELTNKPAATGFNSAYMLEALHALGSQSVEIEFTPGAPILLRDPADRDGHMQVVMAMRV